MSESLFSYILALIAAPLFPGILNTTKAFFAGKHGPPLLMKYYTLAKLFRKGSVYSRSTAYIFRMGPVFSLATALTALIFMPLAGFKPVVSFPGDPVLLFYLLGLGRFFTILAALDTASPFEGMGAAREAFFSTLAEATIFTILIIFYRITGSLSFAEYFHHNNLLILFGPAGALILLVIIALFMVLLVENSRVPVDDPQTHLELTMIHEVMILDHSGPDLALIECGAFAKLMFYSAFIANLLIPFQSFGTVTRLLLFYAGIGLIAVLIGIIESITARFRLNMIPKFILTSFTLAFFAAILTGLIND